MIEPFKISWDIEPTKLQELINGVITYPIDSVELDEINRESTINFIKVLDQETTPKLLNQDYILIPEVLEISNKKLVYRYSKTYYIKDYPAIMSFIETYCPHIKEFIDTEKIETSRISVVAQFDNHTYNSVIASTFQSMMRKKEFLENDLLVQPLILIDLIRQFYLGAEVTSSKSTFELPNHKHIINNILNQETNHYNEIINNPIPFLDKYTVLIDSECVRYRSTGTKAFNFAGIDFFVTSNIEAYKNLMEIKLLDYIANNKS